MTVLTSPAALVEKLCAAGVKVSRRQLLAKARRLGGGGLMAVTLEIGPNGSTVMVEPVLRKGLTRRVFRYMADGSLEWAAYDDWRSQHERARFFGFASRELPASMTS